MMKQKYKNICLTPVRDGERFIPEFFEKNYNFFDGFIFLDDGSKDKTYELLKTDKTIEVIKKPFVDDFEDNLNRQMIFDLTKQIDSDWFIWLDIDEYLYPSINLNTQPNIDYLAFNRVHLWDKPEYYNAEYPHSNQGKQVKFRGFNKNIYNTNFSFINQPKTHFELTPIIHHKTKIFNDTFIIHSGHMDREYRLNKYNFYVNYDVGLKLQPIGYEHLRKENPKILHISNLLK